MQDQIKDLDRLLDIQEFATFIVTYKPLEKDEFVNNKVIQLALLKALENIGEAANQISKATQSEFNQLEWRSMIAARHVYVHDYFKIDWEKIWWSIETINFGVIISSAEEIVATLKKRYSL